jgi:hypothetical protein
MMATSKTYSIANDTLNGAADAAALHQEVLADPGILVALDRVDVSGDDLIVVFKADIDAGTEAALDALVAAHTGESIAEPIQTVALHPDAVVGLPVVQSLDIPPGAADLTTSYQIVAQPNSTANTDIQISGYLVGPQGLCYIAGGAYQCRNSAVIGSALHLSLVDRDDALGMFALLGMTRTRIVMQNVVGTINVGDYVVGASSGARSQVLAVIDPTTIEITFESGWVGGFQRMWVDGEDVVFENANGNPTGASAEFVDWTEGGVIEVQMMVKDEWIEGYDERIIKPGGSKQIPAGFYLRIKCGNTSPTDKLRVKVNFFLATK